MTLDDEKLALRVTQSAVVFLSIVYWAYFAWFDVWSSAWRMLSALVFAAVAELYARRTRRFREANAGLCSALFVSFAIAATMQAGVFSPALPWLAALATIPLLMGSVAVGVTLSGLLLCLVVAMWLHGPTSWFGPSQLVGPAGTQMALAWVAAGALLVPFIALLQMRLRRNHRAMLRQAQQLQALNEAKTRFLSSVSHEIRTPLNGLIGTAALLAKGTMSKDQALRLLQAQEHSAMAMMTLVNSLLDFSKLEAHELQLVKGPVPIHDLVDEVTEMFAGQAWLKGVQVTSSWEPGAPAVIEGDRLRILQVVSNLVSNAVKFTTEGHVHINYGWGDSQRSTVELRVTDSGIGMDTEQLGRLFKPFGQADETISQTYGGTGLGLMLSRELVSMMGGRIEVSSTRGQGSMFSALLPTGQVEGQAATPGPTGKAVLLSRDTRLAAHLRCRLAAHKLELEVTGQWSAALKRSRTAGLLFIDGNCDCAPSREELERLKSRTVRMVALLAPDGSPAAHLRELEALAKPVTTADLERLLAHPETALPDLTVPAAPNSLASVLGDLDSVNSAEPHASPNDTGRSRVLIVEDNYINQVVAKATLERHGFSVDVATDGTAALDLFVKERPSFVLLDLRMPGMSGLDVARVMRRLEAERMWPATPIVAASANLAETDWPACQAAGMNGFLGKPYTPEQLVAAAQHHLGCVTG